MRLSGLMLASMLGGLALPAAAQDVATALPWQGAKVDPNAAGSYSATQYVIDDGTTENSLGWINGGDFVFIMRFEVAGGGTDAISNVLACFGGLGGTFPTNQPVKVFVWDDPNEDGNPYDCIKVGEGAGINTNANTDTFDTFAISPPALVTGRFYVGACVPGPAGTFPGPMDTTSIVPEVAWLTGGPIGTYTGNTINGSFPLTRMSSSNFPCNWLLRAEGGNSDVVYCIPKTNSLGCTPVMTSTGVASATVPSGHTVISSQNRNNKSGILFYGVSGRANTPFQGGTLCVKAPIRRTPAVFSGGSPQPTNDCTGVFSIDMNAFAQGALGGTPIAALRTPGTVVDCQFWGRDPGFPAPNNTSLSEGLEYTVGP